MFTRYQISRVRGGKIYIQVSRNCGCSGCNCAQTFSERLFCTPKIFSKTINIEELHHELIKLDFLHPQFSISYVIPDIWIRSAIWDNVKFCRFVTYDSLFLANFVDFTMLHLRCKTFQISDPSKVYTIQNTFTTNIVSKTVTSIENHEV